MALRRLDEHVILLRQSIVSSARARGMTIAAITSLLSEKGVLNPRTEVPYSSQTIGKDIREIEERWREKMLVDVFDHRARVLAELREVKTAGWSTGKHSIILRAIEQEVNLLGLNELERMGIEIALANLLKGFPREVADQLKALLAKKVQEGKKLENKPKRQKVINLKSRAV